MPKRREGLVENRVFHVFNRGAGKQKIFHNGNDYLQFIKQLTYYRKFDYPRSLYLNRVSTIQKFGGSLEELERQFERQKRLTPTPVDILGYCLMPNHFHLILENNIENGLTYYMHKIGTAYAQYFNMRHNRTGALFQGRFKSVWVESEEHLNYLSRYVHRNPIAANLVESAKLQGYPWSSFDIYVTGGDSLGFPQSDLNMDKVMNSFSWNKKKYLSYVLGEDNDDAEVLEGSTIDDDFGWYDGRF